MKRRPRLCPAQAERLRTRWSGLYGLLEFGLPNLAEGEGFEPPKACTIVVFKTGGPSFASVHSRSPTFALYMNRWPFVCQRSPTFANVRRGCRHGCRKLRAVTDAACPVVLARQGYPSSGEFRLCELFAVLVCPRARLAAVKYVVSRNGS